MGRGWRIYLSPLAGRGRIASAIRVRGSVHKRSGDGLQHAVRIREYVIVPKPNNAIAAVSKPAIAQYIARIIRVLPTIDFNNKSPLPTSEIDNVRTNRKLSDEFLTERARTKGVPKLQLSLRRIKAKIACAFCLTAVGLTHEALPPHPAAFGGRPQIGR